MIVTAWIIAAAVADPSGAAVEVTGSSSCPSAEAVAAALPELLGPRAPDIVADEASLMDDGGAVTVVLRRASGEPMGEKRLDAGLSCEQRARAAAVVIAAWEARLATQPTTLVVAPAAPEAVAVAPRAPPTDAPPPQERYLELGASGGGSINGTTLAPAAAIEAAYPRPSGTVVPGLAALLVGSHTMSVGSGTASWRRYALVATVASRRDWRPIWAEARTGLALTVLDISGSSYPRNGSGVSFDPGALFGARFGLRSSHLRWWLDGTVAFWPRGQDVFVQGAPGSATLPRAQALLSLGAAYELR